MRDCLKTEQCLACNSVQPRKSLAELWESYYRYFMQEPVRACVVGRRQAQASCRAPDSLCLLEELCLKRASLAGLLASDGDYGHKKKRPGRPHGWLVAAIHSVQCSHESLKTCSVGLYSRCLRALTLVMRPQEQSQDVAMRFACVFVHL